jgi:3-oxoacyl-[acyl-carrier protein] reductase
MSKLHGKVALVTGASKGIGAAIALELAAQGAAVAVNYSGSKAGAEKVVNEIKQAGGNAIVVQANVADPDSIGPLINTVVKQLGPIDILVNNAGVYEFGPLEAVTPEHFHKQFNVNVLGLLLTTQAALKGFNPKGGSVINIGSVAAAGIPSASVYSATRFHHRGSCRRTRAEEDPGQLPQPRNDRDRGHAHSGLHRERLPQEDRS